MGVPAGCVSMWTGRPAGGRRDARPRRTGPRRRRGRRGRRAGPRPDRRRGRRPAGRSAARRRLRGPRRRPVARRHDARPGRGAAATEHTLQAAVRAALAQRATTAGSGRSRRSTAACPGWSTRWSPRCRRSTSGSACRCGRWRRTGRRLAADVGSTRDPEIDRRRRGRAGGAVAPGRPAARRGVAARPPIWSACSTTRASAWSRSCCRPARWTAPRWPAGPVRWSRRSRVTLVKAVTVFSTQVGGRSRTARCCCARRSAGTATRPPCSAPTTRR